jgi:O-antigen/teichoic acid export membrane protein
MLLAQGRGPLARGAIISVLLMGGGTVVGYFNQIFISRTLGAEEFGAYAYVLGLLNFVRIIVSFDLDLAALRYVSIYNSRGDWSSFRGFVSGSRRFVLVMSMVGAGVCFALALYFRHRLQPSLFYAIAAGCLFLAPASLLSLEAALLQALRSVYGARIPNQFIRPIAMAGVLYFLVRFTQFPPTGSTAILANVVGAIIALVVSFGFMQRRTTDAIRHATPKAHIREWARFCLLNLAGSLAYLVLSQQADIVIVGSLVGTKDAGLYSAASQISTLVLIGVVAVNQFTSPLLAQFHAEAQDIRLRTLLSRVMILNSSLSVPIITFVVALGPLVLQTFGPAFVTAYPVILILVVGNLVNATWGALWGDLLTMTGFQTESAVLVGIVTSLNLLLTFILTPRLGIVGAASATTAAVLVRGVLLAFVIRKRLHFWPWTVWRSLR